MRHKFLKICFCQAASLQTAGAITDITGNEHQCSIQDEQCLSSLSWPPLHEQQVNLTDRLGCRYSPDAPGEVEIRSVAAYCVATQFGSGCSGTDFENDKSECLRRCIFSTPDLNFYGSITEAGISPSWRLSPLLAHAYRNVPFLDTRSLKHGLNACQFYMPMEQLKELAVDVRVTMGQDARVGFIFHLAHVSSTLMSRALGEIQGMFVLREPYPLTMAASTPSLDEHTLTSLWNVPLLPLLSRRYKASDFVVVKANSKAIRFMNAALDWGNRVVFMYSGLRTHLTVCLARPKDVFPEDLYEALDVQGGAFKKYRAGTDAYQALSDVQRMTLAWLKRMSYVLKMKSPRLKMMSMQEFLGQPAKKIIEASRFFGVPLEKSKASAIVSSHIFKEYSKDTSVPWNHSVQNQLMVGRADVYRNSIEEGVAFAEHLLDAYKFVKGISDLIEE